MTAYRAGRLLRANGRWSLTHLWKQSDRPPLETMCHLIYGANDIYAGGDVEEVFMDEPVIDDWLTRTLTRCEECFEDGAGKVVTALPSGV